jgi:hypothetical protein
MVRGLGFVVLLYAMGAICLLIGAGDLYEASRFWLHGARGYVECTDPDLANAIKNDLVSPRVDVSYVTPTGRVEVAQMGLSADEARRLATGQRIPVLFLTSKPEYAYFAPRKPESPWGYLIVGLGLSLAASYGLRLYRRERDG